MHEEMQELKECDGYKEYFNLKAAQVNEFQNLVKSSLGTKLTSGDEMAMYKSRFDQYISEANDVIIKHADMQKMNEYVGMYE